MLSIFSCVHWPSICFLWRNVCLGLLPISFDSLLAFLILSFMSCLYILEINPLTVASFAIIFSHSEEVSFNLVYCFLFCAKDFKFNQVPFVYFCFYFHYFQEVGKRESCYDLYQRRHYICFPLRTLDFPALHLSLKSILSLFLYMVLVVF